MLLSQPKKANGDIINHRKAVKPHDDKILILRGAYGGNDTDQKLLRNYNGGYTNKIIGN